MSNAIGWLVLQDRFVMRKSRNSYGSSKVAFPCATSRGEWEIPIKQVHSVLTSENRQKWTDISLPVISRWCIFCACHPLPSAPAAASSWWKRSLMYNSFTSLHTRMYTAVSDYVVVFVYEDPSTSPYCNKCEPRSTHHDARWLIWPGQQKIGAEKG